MKSITETIGPAGIRTPLDQDCCHFSPVYLIGQVFSLEPLLGKRITAIHFHFLSAGSDISGVEYSA